MFKKILISVVIILTATINILFAGEEVNIEAASINIPNASWGYSSENEADFVAPSNGKYIIQFECDIDNWNESYCAMIKFGIENIYPTYNQESSYELIPSWLDHLTRTLYVDLEEGVEYTIWGWFYNSYVTLSNVTVTSNCVYTYERDFMVSLPFDEYFDNINDNVTFNPLMSGGSGSYFDYTGYAWADAKFDFEQFSPHFKFDFQGTINDDIEIHPPFNKIDPTEHIYFQETYNSCPFLNVCSNTVTYLGDFEMVDYEDDEAYFGDRMFNFEYAPNYANLTSIEFTIESSDNCHPLLEWSPRYSDFFDDNGLQNYFETVIKRRKYGPTGVPIEDWNVIATISPDLNYYEDTELESPDPDPEPGGTFGIEGTAKYTITLQQTPANPNYNADWANQVCGESSIRSILYGQNSGGGEQNPMLYGVFNLNIVDLHNPIISFTIKDDAYANTSVKIYNIRGQLIQTLLDEPLSKGRHTLIWNGTDTNNRTVSSGLYLVQICRGNEKTAKKISLLR